MDDEYKELENYEPLFEIGLVHQLNPAIKVLDNFEIKPATLAALCTGVFESVMRSVPESKQVEYEHIFMQCLTTLMNERHNFDVVYKGLPEDEQ
jgi:hypothetical protein